MTHVQLRWANSGPAMKPCGLALDDRTKGRLSVFGVEDHVSGGTGTPAHRTACVCHALGGHGDRTLAVRGKERWVPVEDVDCPDCAAFLAHYLLVNRPA